MNTLKFGNGEWYGKKDTILAYNDENSNFKPLPFSFDRASSATRVNKDGLIETVGSGEPRIDYKDDSKGALLLEPSRSNSLVQSNQFDTTWTTTNATVTSGQRGVGGSSDAWLLSKSSVGGRINQSISLNGVQTTSIYAKANTSNWIAFISGGSKTAYFDLQNGVLGTVSGTAIDAKIESVGNGWYRCSLIQDVTLTEIRVYIAEDDLDVSGTSGSIYIQYAQVEQGSYATSYLPTQGGAVTRVADVCTNGGNEQVINSTEGVLYAEMSALANDLTQRFISLSDGTTTNRLILGFDNSSNRIISFARVGGALSFDIKETVSNIQSYNKIAIKWKENDFALWSNGVELGIDTSGASFSSNVLNTLKFSDADGTTEIFNGNTKDVRVYNTALTDSELQALTTI